MESSLAIPSSNFFCTPEDEPGYNYYPNDKVVGKEPLVNRVPVTTEVPANTALRKGIGPLPFPQGPSGQPGTLSGIPKKKGPTAEERAEAWEQAMADAQGFMSPMQGDTIPGAIVGEKARIETGPYETAGGDIQTAGLLSAAPDAFWKKKLWI